MDSDDEYDRKRRDKFRGERSAGADSYRVDRRDERRIGVGGGGGGRDEWIERGRGRPDYYRGGGARERYSPGRELPPPKRMRPDWNEDNRPRYGGHDAYGMYGWGHDHYPPPMHGMHGFGGGGGGHVPISTHNREAQQQSDMQTQPPMLTLKQFLDTQDDGISDAEVLRKYSEYKLEFKRQQLNEFFVAHKDEEWFKNKYHPKQAQKRKSEQLGFLKKRVDVFMELLEKGLITSVSVDINQADQLLRLLDTVVIKLEGGTDDDLKVLDEKPTDIIIRPFESNVKKNLILKDQDDDDVIITDDIKPKNKENDEDINWEPIPSKMKKTSKTNNDNDDEEENWDNADNDSIKKDENDKCDVEGENWTPISSKIKINKNPDNDDENWDDVNTSHEDEKRDVDDENKKKYDVKDSSPKTKANDGERSGWEDDENSVDSSNKIMPQKSRNNSESSTTSSQESKREKKTEEETRTTDKEIEDKYGVDKNDLDEDKASDVLSTHSTRNEQQTTIAGEKQEENDDKTETIDLDKLKDPDTNDETNKPRALHRTSSIFLRNLAPTITKSEIKAICNRYDGFLRVAIADPLVERRWFRRGWVTFQRDVNIKEICWNLNNIRLRDCEMGAIVNRDLSRRVRPVNGITAHKTIVRSDIKLLARIALNFDEKFELWTEKQDSGDGTENGDVRKEKSFGFNSKNPVLQNITDYLIEEASAEEDELLGLSSETTSNEGETLERDPQLIHVLDKLILYMRIVHSLDYYNHCEYPYEDEMPNRCGIIHARGPPPSNKITKQDIEEYVKNFESKMISFLTKATPIDEEELKNLGCKDADAEVEKFVQANTQELSKDKWLCPLSGKKFKGPEFIKKHIFNKHMEKVEEVRKEVEYFNNYLKDPKRPQLPEHPGNTKRSQPPSDSLGGPQMPYRPGYPATGYAPPYAAYAPPIIAPPRPRAFGNRRMPSINHRPMIHYRDLDALDDTMDTL